MNKFFAAIALLPLLFIIVAGVYLAIKDTFFRCVLSTVAVIGLIFLTPLLFMVGLVELLK